MSSEISDILHRAFIAFDEDKLLDAEELYGKCLALIHDDSSLEYYQCRYGAAFVFAKQGKYDAARSIYRDLLKCAANQQDHERIAVLNYQLAMVERMAGQYDEAIAYLDVEDQIIRSRFENDFLGHSANAYERGYIAHLRGKYTDAVNFLQLALRHGEAAEDLICKACAWRGLGEVHASIGDKQEARRYLALSWNAFQSAGDVMGAREVKQIEGRILDS